ncbi:YlcI/YnfO family protein [Luteimonas sp. RD2P54]|uniref:YlcI/YnfO family protein n=1 Tax=Luteimonas endophytica TaxID=3042023 RepID=A0ABT6J673_9GAMM|nr:YlcI/YnfO family protein [Luteimonas endophytica]MDH5821708.1 YlcI/YnfO family protein [Luteimonas endophytica]
MKTASLPWPPHVDSALRQTVESVLQEGETCSSFIEKAIRTEVQRRQQQAAFITRGLASRERARSSGRFVDADEVLAALEARRAGTP